MNTQILSINNKEEFDMIITKAKAVFVDYSASWCGPCKRLNEDLHIWIDKEDKFKNVTVIKIMVDNDNLESLSEHIKSLPTIQFYKNGKRIQFPYNEDGKCYLMNEIRGYDKKKIIACLEWLDS